VIGVDLSEGMLAQARRKTGDFPIEFRKMDAERLEFDDATFDVVLCGFGIFFLSDMVRGVCEMRRVLRLGGRLAFSTAHQAALEPLMEMTLTCLERYGVPRIPPLWRVMKCEEPEQVLTLLEKGEFQRKVFFESAGYYIEPEDWWTILWGTGVAPETGPVVTGGLRVLQKGTPGGGEESTKRARHLVECLCLDWNGNQGSHARADLREGHETLAAVSKQTWKYAENMGFPSLAQESDRLSARRAVVSRQVEWRWCRR
jgi:SAM-dependent methyltransferase